MWIPVHIVNDDCVSRCKVDAKSTSTCWQQKYKLLRIDAWKLVNKNFPSTSLLSQATFTTLVKSKTMRKEEYSSDLCIIMSDMNNTHHSYLNRHEKLVIITSKRYSETESSQCLSISNYIKISKTIVRQIQQSANKIHYNIFHSKGQVITLIEGGNRNWLLTVESVNAFLTFVTNNTTVNSFIAITMEHKEIFQYVQHTCHLYTIGIFCFQ